MQERTAERGRQGREERKGGAETAENGKDVQKQDSKGGGSTVTTLLQVFVWTFLNF